METKAEGCETNHVHCAANCIVCIITYCYTVLLFTLFPMSTLNVSEVVMSVHDSTSPVCRLLFTV
jgi:hypothetical protein